MCHGCGWNGHLAPIQDDASGSDGATLDREGTRAIVVRRYGGEAHLFQLRKLLHLLTSALLLFSVSCKKETTEHEIERWIKRQQHTKVIEYVQNPNNPLDQRLSALVLLVEYGRIPELQSAVEKVPDRAGFFEALVKRLRAQLGDKSLPVQVEAKRALFAILNYLDKDQQDAQLAHIAQWAYGSLGPDTPQDALVQRLQNETQITGELMRMGRYGVPPVAWLFSHGLNTREFAPFLLKEADTPELQRIVVAALKKLLVGDIEVEDHHIALLDAMPIAESVALLLDISMREQMFESDKAELRDTAIASAQEMIKQQKKGQKRSVVGTPAERALVTGAIQKLFASREASDRWDAFELMVVAGADAGLGLALDGLKDGAGDWSKTFEDRVLAPLDVIADICAFHFLKAPARFRPQLEARLTSKVAIQKAFAIVCLKAMADPASIPALQAVAEDPASLETFFFDARELASRRAKQAEQTLPVLTVGLLAKNAALGITLLGELAAQQKAGEIPEREAKLRRESILAVIGFEGDAMRGAIERQYATKYEKEFGKPLPTPPPIAPPTPEKAPPVAPPDKKGRKAGKQRGKKRGKTR